MDGEDLSTYIRKQDNLNAKGVTVLMAEALAHHSPGSEGDFSDTAAELMIELVGGEDRVCVCVCVCVCVTHAPNALHGPAC